MQVLLALTSAQWMQTLAAMDANNIAHLNDRWEIKILDRLKSKNIGRGQGATHIDNSPFNEMILDPQPLPCCVI